MRAVAGVVASVIAAGLIVAGPRPVHAQEQTWEPVPLRPTKHSRDIVVEIPGERSTHNKIMLGALAGIGVLGSAVGLYFHLDSRDTANQVSANDMTGIPWTASKQDLVDQNGRAKIGAAIGYAVGGGFLVALVAVYIATNPPSETEVITTTAMRPIIEPTANGATVGAAWSF